MVRNVTVKAKSLVTIQDNFGHLLAIDATLNEEHTRSAQATMHEIEGGDEISDHVIKKGTQLTLNGIISEDAYPEESHTIGIDDNPPGVSAWTGDRFQRIGSGAFAGIVGSLAGGGIAGAAVTGVYSKLSGSLLQKAAEAEAARTRQLIANTGNNTNQIATRVKDAYDILDQIYENKISVLIITGLTAYNNMVMESLSMPRNPGTTRSLPFTASFRKVNFAFSETVNIPAMADKATADRATPKKNQGNQSAAAPGDKAKEKGSSLLYKITGAAGLHR